MLGILWGRPMHKDLNGAILLYPPLPPYFSNPLSNPIGGQTWPGWYPSYLGLCSGCAYLCFFTLVTFSILLIQCAPVCTDCNSAICHLSMPPDVISGFPCGTHSFWEPYVLSPLLPQILLGVESFCPLVCSINFLYKSLPLLWLVFHCFVKNAAQPSIVSWPLWMCHVQGLVYFGLRAQFPLLLHSLSVYLIIL